MGTHIWFHISWRKFGGVENTSAHYNDVIMGAMASQITSRTIVYSTVYSGADQRKHQSSASLAFVRGIHRWPVNSPHIWPVTRKMFSFDETRIFQDNEANIMNADSPWWRHQMKTFSALLPLCAGNLSVTGEFISQRPVTRCFLIKIQLSHKKTNL